MTLSTYVLAVDIGTSRTAASTARITDGGRAEASRFALGRQADSAPSAVFVSPDELLFGEAAERRGLAQPERLVREFKRRIGDDVPLVVGGQSIAPERLYAQALESVIAQGTEREGARPEAIAVTHPTTWGSHRLKLIRNALAQSGIGDVQFISEPEAAARHYEATRTLVPGETLAVYDLGGGTFDTAVLRKMEDGSFAILAPPLGLGELGGADFDDAVLRHVIRSANLDVAELAAGDSDTRLALGQLRRECTEAKEALSFDSEATIPVVISTDRSSVRLTRTEFEGMIDGALDETIEVLETALENAHVDVEDLTAILLIGGSSRIPRVAQRISEHFDRPIAVDADPKLSIAMGAARTTLIRIEDERMGLIGAPMVPYVAAAAALDLADATAAESSGELVLAAPAPVGEQPRKRSVLYPVAIVGGSLAIAATLIVGGTLTAAAPPRDVEFAAESTPTPTPTATPGALAGAAPAAAPAEAPVAESGSGDSGSSQRNTSRSNPRQNAAAPTPAPSQPQASPPRPAQPSNPPSSGGGTTNPQPSDPPVTPSDPPVTPSDPPVEPSDPPVTPSDPPAEPEPSQAPAPSASELPVAE